MAVYSDEFIDKLRRFVELRDDRDISKTAADRTEEAYREAEGELWEEINDSDQTPKSGTIKVNLGEPYGEIQFGRRETIYGRVLDYDEALEWLNATARTDEFTQPRIVKSRVNEIVRERYEEGQPMPPGLDFIPRRYVAVTRSKS